MTKITQEAFTDALIRARVIDANDLGRIGRIVIDVRPHRPVDLHVQYVGEDNLLDVLPLLAGDTEGTMIDG